MLVDGELVCACLVLAAAAVGRGSPPSRVVTGRRLRDPTVLSDVQQAFVDEGAVQCGFCTPGLVMAVHDLLDRCPTPTSSEIREAISGNLCRCTGYGRIVAAVQVAAGDRRACAGTSAGEVAP